MQRLLRDYGQYRYGGKAQLTRQKPPQDAEPGGYHQTVEDMLSRIAELKTSADKQDAKLLNSLESFYRNSDLFLQGGLSPAQDIRKAQLAAQ